MAVCLCTRESVKMMRANGVDDGHIININSLSGHRCGKAHFYSATKHTVTALTEGIRWELREINSHIKVTSISPGLVKTNFAYTAVGEAAAEECYSTRQSLDPQDISNAIETVLSYPSHVQVSEMMIRPTEQAVTCGVNNAHLNCFLIVSTPPMTITDLKAFRSAINAKRMHKVDNGCLVKGKCHRSQRKNESPHDIEIILLDGPILQCSKCSCAIGKLGTCGHVTGLLYSLAHMKTCNYKSIPSDVLKTSLPQSWHMPRGEKVKGNTADDVIVVGYNTKSPYRQPRGLRSTFYNPIKVPLPPVADLCSAISDIDNSCLLLSVTSHHNTSNMIETRFGKYPKGSPISYQQKLSSHFILNVLDADFPFAS
ncbi:DHRS11 [Mytilus coruscus]|uniref:DHRS11 n=1 Tax=Mytilus coruscus TaxID=42192 RepID=A0A6J8EJ51_MYTCO|nr:DHRS11 [Mytilus coruscus]